MTRISPVVHRIGGAMAAALLVVACESATGPGLKRIEWEQARARWATAAVQDYAYEANWSGAWIRVTAVRVVVSGGTVDSVIDLATGQPATGYETVQFGRTIDDLFAIIGDRVTRGGDDSRVSYDPTRGFPTNAILNDNDVADDEVQFSVRLVRP